MNKITYICDIDQDIDDIIAVEYLLLSGKLKDLVLDPLPITQEGQSRLSKLIKNGIKINNEIQPNSNYIFVGGAFTKLAKYLKHHKVNLIVANGGFVGSNLVEEEKQIQKFKKKEFIRTYNFNLDIISTIDVLNSNNFDKMLLIGKNVCHNIYNTTKYLWKSTELLDNFNLSPEKRLHDLLMCQEGLSFLENNYSKLLEIKQIKPINQGVNGNMTKWGSELSNNSNIFAATYFK